MKYNLLAVILIFVVLSCSNEKKQEGKKAEEQTARIVNVPRFNGDSAYVFIKQQVDFGPRVPNSKPHRATADFLIKKLKNYGASVSVQEFESANYQGEMLALKNIIATFGADKTKRILLAAHWDTRPFADKDKDKPNAAFEGANDGASGVGVLLEIARQINSQSPEVGVDIILFDGEDWGEKEGSQGTHPLPDNLKEWWCLGSQYWSKNKHKTNYSAYYGILVDMVGAKNAQFHREGFSLEYAPSVVEKVWNTASRLGYSHVFVKRNQPAITDDHVFVNVMGKIPMIDIVHYDPAIGYFGDFHHSQKDNMQIISKETLQIVGETVLNVLYYEQ